MITSLCVGGSKNGEVITVQDGSLYLKVPVMTKINWSADPTESFTYETETYRLETMKIFGVRLRLLLHESLQTHDAKTKAALLAMLKPEVLDMVDE